MWLTNYWFSNQLQSYQPSNRLEIAIPRLFSEWCVRLYIFSWFVNSPPDQEGGRKKRMIITKNKVPAAATGSQKDQGALSLALSLSLSLSINWKFELRYYGLTITVNMAYSQSKD